MAGSADGHIIINTQINTNDVNAGIQDIESRVEKLADRMRSTGETMTKAITVPMTAIGAAGIAAAASVGESQTKIQNSLGITKEQAEALTDSAKNIYKAGFGESLGEVSDALIKTKQNIKGLNDEQLEKITKSALNLAQTFDADVNEVTRAGQNLVKGFGIDAEEAFDLMAHGAQNGLNFSQEMFDNLSEYAPLFGEMGFSAEEYFQLLEQGSKAGVYNLDYINDAMKEFQIKIKDGSKSTSEAMDQMSDGTQKVWKDFLKGKGTVKDVHNTVIKELKGMKDQVKANEIGVGLYGTKWEDMEADAMYALGNIDGGIKGAKGSMEEMNKVTEESFGTKWKAFTREALMALEPLGKVLLDFAMAVLPTVSAAIQKVSEWFGNLSPVGQQVTVVIGMIAAAIGPFLTIVGMMIGPITNVINVLSKLGPMFTVVRTALTALTGPIGIIIAIVGTLAVVIYKNWDDISKWTVETWGKIKNFLANVWDGIKLIYETSVKAMKEFISKAWDWIKETTSKVWNGIKNFFKEYWDEILAIFTGPIGILVYTIVKNWDAIKAKTKEIWDAVKSKVQSSWQGIKDKTNEVMNAVRTKVQEVWNYIKSFIQDKAQAIWQAVKDRFYKLKDVVQEGMNRVKETAQRLWGYVEDFFERINLESIGRNIIQGLINGFWDKFDSLMSTARSIANSISEKIRSAWDVRSPSRVAFAIGSYYTQGIEGGLLDRAKHLMKAATQIGDTVAIGTRKPLESARMDISNQKLHAAQTASSPVSSVGDRVIQLIMPNVRNERDARGISIKLHDLESRNYRVGGVNP